MTIEITIPEWLYEKIINEGMTFEFSPELYWAIYKGKIIEGRNE